MEVKLESINADNVDACVDLYMNTFSKEPWYDQYDSREQVANYFLRFMEMDSFVGFVGMAGGKAAAISVGMKKPWINGVEYYIDEFCVDYAQQGKGIGSSFIQLIEAELPKLGLNGMMLNTEEEFPSFRFYTKNGFKKMDGCVVLVK